MNRPAARRVLLAGAVAFVVLAALASAIGVLPGDGLLRQATLDLLTPPILAFLRVVNHAGSWRVLLPCTLLLVVALPSARARWHVWTGLMLAAPALEGVAKLLVARPRPEDQALGFPSGHATAAAAFFGALLYLAAAVPQPAARRLIRGLAVAAIALVALARVALRAHWPSDVAGGIALGLALASGAALLALPHRSPGARRPEPPVPGPLHETP